MYAPIRPTNSWHTNSDHNASHNILLRLMIQYEEKHLNPATYMQMFVLIMLLHGLNLPSQHTFIAGMCIAIHMLQTCWSGLIREGSRNLSF